MLNRVIVIGNLVEEPEIRYTAKGTAVGKIRLAVARTFNRNETDFFNIITWRGVAEKCANYLHKGSQVGVEGRLQNRSYEAQGGSKRWVTEIIADNVHFLGSKGSKAESPPGNEDWSNQQEPSSNAVASEDDEIPY